MKFDKWIEMANSIKESLKDKVEEPNFEPPIEKILKMRYFKKGEDWDKLCRRVAKCATRYYPDNHKKFVEDFYHYLMYYRILLPNTPALINADENGGMNSACFYLPIEDSLDGIGDTLVRSMKVFAKGGGVGFQWSNLRPEGALIKSTGKTSTGVIPFMEMYNAMCEAINQGGVRRGAMMGMLSIEHKDIRKFILSKRDTTKLTNFNISVSIPDSTFDIINSDEDKSTVHEEEDLFNLICESAWLTGEPGVYYWDTVQNANSFPEDGELGSNPCGESCLSENESCNLASINLTKVAGNPKLLANVTMWSIRFLNDLLINNVFPDNIIAINTIRRRKLGLGICGWHDALIMSKTHYASEKALNLAEKTMSEISIASFAASNLLMQDEAIDYMQCFKDKINMGIPVINQKNPATGKEEQVLNGTRLAIAPTGTLSLLMGVSHSIEPIFATEYTRRDASGEYTVVHPLYAKLRNKKEYQEYFETAHDVSPEWHVRMVAAFQKHVDQGISKSVNLPQDATVEDVRKVFLLGHKLGCKALTVYRDKSRENVYTAKNDNESIDSHVLDAKVARIRGGCGKICVTLSHDSDKNPRDIFVNLGKGGGCANAWAESVGRLSSQVLQLGGSIQENIIKQLQGIRCPQSVFSENGVVSSCCDGIAKALVHISETEPEKQVDQSHAINANLCPECGSNQYRKQGGCDYCDSCGFSRCG